MAAVVQGDGLQNRLRRLPRLEALVRGAHDGAGVAAHLQKFGTGRFGALQARLAQERPDRLLRRCGPRKYVLHDKVARV